MTYQPKAGSGSQTTIPSIIDIAWRHFGVDLYRPGEGPIGPPFPDMNPYAIFKSDQPPHQMPDQDLNTASQQTDGTYSPAPNEIVYVCNVCYYNCASKALPNNIVTCAFKGLIDTLVLLSPAQAEMYFSNKADFLHNCARRFITCGVILLELSEPIAATMEELRSRPESYDEMIRRFEMENPIPTPIQVPTQTYQYPQVQDQEPVQTPVSPIPSRTDEDNTLDSACDSCSPPIVGTYPCSPPIVGTYPTTEVRTTVEGANN